MAKVIIVGNGVIVGKGKLIDSYDTVIRINHLDKPYKVKNRGKKIDIWALIGSKKNVPSTRKKFPSIKEVWAFSGPHKNQDIIWMRNVRTWLGVEPTTGMFTIMMALKRFKKIDIIGFDFFTKRKIHYWDDDTPTYLAIRGHEPLKERKIIKGWEQDKIVRFI